MSERSRPIAPLGLCRNLSWKGRHSAMDDEERLLVVLHNHVPYTCLRTCQPWGVDDGPAVPERCCPGRPCYDAPR